MKGNKAKSTDKRPSSKVQKNEMVYEFVAPENNLYQGEQLVCRKVVDKLPSPPFSRDKVTENRMQLVNEFVAQYTGNRSGMKHKLGYHAKVAEKLANNKKKIYRQMF